MLSLWGTLQWDMNYFEKIRRVTIRELAECLLLTSPDDRLSFLSTLRPAPEGTIHRPSMGSWASWFPIEFCQWGAHRRWALWELFMANQNLCLGTASDWLYAWPKVSSFKAVFSILLPPLFPLPEFGVVLLLPALGYCPTLWSPPQLPPHPHLCK